MRRGILPALLLAAALALPAAGVASEPGKQPAPQEPAEGCLAVENGKGIVTVVARGGIFGRFDSGRVTIEDLVPGDTRGPKVFGAQDVITVSDTKTQYVGTNVRFRFTGGGAFRVTVNASGIDLSVIARGWAVLNGAGWIDPGTYSVDNASLCTKGFKPLPSRPTKTILGSVLGLVLGG